MGGGKAMTLSAPPNTPRGETKVGSISGLHIPEDAARRACALLRYAFDEVCGMRLDQIVNRRDAVISLLHNFIQVSLKICFVAVNMIKFGRTFVLHS